MPDAIKELIDEVVEEYDKLNDWEQGFVESVSERFKNGYPLTAKQISCLENISEKLRKG